MRFVSRSGRVLAAITAAVLGLAAATSLSPFDVGALLRVLAVVGFGCTVLYVAFWRPSLDVGDNGVTVRNLVSTHHIEWGAIARIDTKWGLTLVTDRRTVSVWAAPAPGRHAALLASRDQGTHLPESTYLAGTVRPGDLVTSESGGAAAVVRREWERRHADAGGRDDRHISAPLVVALGVLGTAAAAALFL
jgi:hypothetical protein